MEFAKLREELLEETKQAVAESVHGDTLIVTAVSTLEALEQALNTLVKKGREWYGLYNPGAERGMEHERFVREAPDERGEMGGELTEEDRAALNEYRAALAKLYDEREALREYITTRMQGVAPNLAHLAGPIIGAKLLHHAGTLERLATMPSGTLQLLGAERALFRHLHDKRHASPKYGLLFNHPLVQHAKERGKAARALADKLSLCAKLDRFNGEYLAERYAEELGQRFGWSR